MDEQDLYRTPPPPGADEATATTRAFEVRRLGVASLAKVTSVIMAVIGFIVGAMWALFSLLFAAALGAESGAAEAGALMGLGVTAIILFPIVYGLMGLAVGAINALVYNWAARTIGGVRLTLAEV